MKLVKNENEKSLDNKITDEEAEQAFGNERCLPAVLGWERRVCPVRFREPPALADEPQKAFCGRNPGCGSLSQRKAQSRDGGSGLLSLRSGKDGPLSPLRIS